MKNTIEHMSLQQARKNSDIPLSTMARLLITDVSNLSKYERGIKKPHTDIYLGYHLITGAPLESLFRGRVTNSLENVAYQIKIYLNKLKDETRSIKIESLVSRLNKALDTINCLQDVTETHND